MSNETFDNITKILKDDLSSEIKEKANISVSANCFSIYAYQELRKELNKVKNFRFIFTSPTFLNEKTPKEKREFFIPRLERERNIYGTKYEVRLTIDGNKIENIFRNFINQISLDNFNGEKQLSEEIINNIEQEKIIKQIKLLENKAKNEKQLDKKFEITQEIKRLKSLLK